MEITIPGQLAQEDKPHSDVVITAQLCVDQVMQILRLVTGESSKHFARLWQLKNECG